jgi:prepilin-type N-terminal cleavage/methylation domain-containing protein
MGGIKRPHGFTIVEIMIVLAVSGLLLISAFLLVSGKQQNTEFDLAIREIQSEIQQDIGNVTNGFYPNSNNVSCTSSSNSAPNITSSSTQSGTNLGCTFIGVALNFLNPSASTNPFQYAYYTVVGRECALGSSPQNGCTQAATLPDELPVALAPSSGHNSYPDLSSYPLMQGGLKISLVQATTNGVNSNVGSVAFLSSPTNSQQVDMYAVPNSNQGTDHIVSGYKNGTEISNIDNNLSTAIPASRVDMCFLSGTTSEWGVISIIQGSGQLQTSLEVFDKNAPQPSTC